MKALIAAILCLTCVPLLALAQDGPAPQTCLYANRPMPCQEAYERLGADFDVEMAAAATFRQTAKDGLFGARHELTKQIRALTQEIAELKKLCGQPCDAKKDANRSDDKTRRTPDPEPKR